MEDMLKIGIVKMEKGMKKKIKFIFNLTSQILTSGFPF